MPGCLLAVEPSKEEGRDGGLGVGGAEVLEEVMKGEEEEEAWGCLRRS